MKFAFVFPGQGSQSVGMLDSFSGNAEVAATLDEASKALGQDVAALIAQGPAEALNLTTNTQPVMLTAGVAIYRAWRAAGGAAPAMASGHSLGEYSALVAAGALQFADAAPLVRFRAQAMQEAVPVGEGGMAAILGLSDEDVLAACAQARDACAGVVEAVNFNAPSQVVIAGAKAAVAAACEAAKAKGSKRVLPLPVSAPFHSSLLAPASLRLKDYLQKVAISAPAFPMVNNVDVAVVRDPDAIKDALVRQAAAPVRWVETVRAMAEAGVTHIVECGPGRVLAGLTKRIAPDIISTSITDPASLEEALTLLK
ncbi:MAG: ACP S-malonyltransferase [Candidatus Protistobacter heckmanni]|nr:ACP S-malonyltransferase [Candidatus Protistobacter heckmanni]